MPRLTPQAQVFIKKYPDLSSRKLALLIFGNFEEKYSHVAINDYQRKLKQGKVVGLVQAAITKGDLIRPTICENCGRTTDDIQGHHKDYDKPLEVDWLCRGCHRDTFKHKMSQAAKKGHANRETSSSLQTLRKNYPKDKPQNAENSKIWNFTQEKLTFSEFMSKLEKANSFSAKQLREKLQVKGRHKQINQDRILRIIQYTIDVVQE